ncbi:ATP-binding cassette domain-containing protein [Methylomicrobium lacus]|uniref:ATP-binding cassette domain-containing protein n=1 Tax=Methylomicrobium lacus TaxID=136992 RepID=UPI0035A84DCF
MKPKRRWLVPELVQTSAMDCGPASLKALLEGYRIPVSYGRLREACQTDVDGTSIDVLEETATLLGLEAEQVMLPLDHLLLTVPDSLPAIVVTQPNGGDTHFAVFWRRCGPFVQVMDPAIGRRWLRAERFLAEIYRHSQAVPAEDWRDWAGSDDFLPGLRSRLAAVTGTEETQLIESALTDASWFSLAALDAATRMVEALARNGGVKRGREGRAMLRALYRAAAEAPSGGVIPPAFWQVSVLADSEDGEQLLLKGAVLIRINGVSASPPEAELSPDLAAALAAEPDNAWRIFARFMRDIGLHTPLILTAALLVGGAVLMIEALLFRGLVDLVHDFDSSGQRLAGILCVALLAFALLLAEYANARELLRLGRQLEIRMRLAFLRKVPLLNDRFFNSRPISDMAERAHVVQQLRALPQWGGQVLRCGVELAMTTAGIAWLFPGLAPWAVLTALAAIAIPLLAQPALSERDLRARVHNAALGRFFLDALHGLAAVRVHGAERTVRAQHEALLSEYARARLQELRVALLTEGAQALISTGLAVWLLLRHYQTVGDSGGFLLLVYWTLKLPALGQQMAILCRQYSPLRNVALRVIEPLGARDETNTPADNLAETPAMQSPVHPGVTIDFRGVSAHAGGHSILNGLDLTLPAGSHVAIVGASGAGKSSLAGMLLGWMTPAFGEIRVDGETLDAARLDALRRDTAWLEPAVQLWNRPLLDNLLYGSPQEALAGVGEVLELADLHEILQDLPDGLQTSLGEGGALLSGGQGQRVRLGRALLKRDARLVILDEPFRSLERKRRETYLATLRAVWPEATLLCITHDIVSALDFERVLVMDGGRVVEDAAPAALAALPDSRFRALLDAENAALESLWADSAWQNLWLDRGRLRTDQEPAG